MSDKQEEVTGGMALLTNKQAADRIGRAAKTLEYWRHMGTGPRFVVDDGGRFLGYRPETIDEYLKGQECQSTAEAKTRQNLVRKRRAAKAKAPLKAAQVKRGRPRGR